MADEKEKRELEQKAEEKKKELPWWQNLSPLTIGIAGLGGFLIIRSIMVDVENKNTYMFYLIGLATILYLLSRTTKAKEEVMITPKEAELLAERECERKRRWEQFGPMTKYKIGPVSNLMHRDAMGMYYDVAVEVTSPYDRPVYYTAKVMAKGIERGFTTLIESIGPMSGREKDQEKTIIPEWAQRVGVSTVLEKMMFGKER